MCVTVTHLVVEGGAGEHDGEVVVPLGLVLVALLRAPRVRARREADQAVRELAPHLQHNNRLVNKRNNRAVNNPQIRDKEYSHRRRIQHKTNADSSVVWMGLQFGSRPAVGSGFHE